MIHNHWFVLRKTRPTKNGIFPYAFEEYGYDIFKENAIRLTNGDYIDYAPPGGND